MNKVNAAGYGGRKANAVVGAIHVVVHCFGDGDNGKVLSVQPVTIAQGVITPNGNEHVNLELL